MDTWWREQINRYPLLTPSQEISLGSAVRQWLDHPPPVPALIERRGRKAMDRIVNCNLRLVLSIADRYRSVPEHYYDDLIQAGNMGLMRAVEKFDHSRGYKFSTYAYWWIRQSINNWLHRYSRTISLPMSYSADWSKINDAIQSLTESLGRVPTLSEIAERSGLKVDAITRLLQHPVASVSLDTPLPSDDGTISDLISSPNDIDLFDDVDCVMESLHRLTPLRQRIIRQVYGIGEDRVPSAQIAKAEGISRERLRFHVRQALQQLRMVITLKPAPLKKNNSVMEDTEQLQLSL